MLIRQIYADNAYRNFHYLIACPETGEALVIDPLDAERCLAAAQAEGWRITQIVNSHEHWDHIGGNDAVVAATGATILAHAGARDKIPGVTTGLLAGDVIKVGSSVTLHVLDTPGHTMAHVCLLGKDGSPALFCGDTLFNAGAGNCKHGGHPRELYETFSSQLALLPDDTRIFPGHDYILNNLAFTLDREPHNETAARLLDALKNHDPHHARITTLREEKQINTFFRLQSPDVIAALRSRIQDFPEHPQDEDVFLALRELRNHW